MKDCRSPLHSAMSFRTMYYSRTELQSWGPSHTPWEALSKDEVCLCNCKPTRQPVLRMPSPAPEHWHCTYRYHGGGELRSRGHKLGQCAGRPLAGVQQQLRERLAGAPPDLRCAARVPQRGWAVLCCGHADSFDLQPLQVCLHAHLAARLSALSLLMHTRTCMAYSPSTCTSLYKGVLKHLVAEAGCVYRHDVCICLAEVLTASHMLQRGRMQQRPVGVRPLRQVQRAVRRGDRVANSHLQGGERLRPCTGGRMQRDTAGAAPAAPVQPDSVQAACLGSRGLGRL